MGERKHLVLNPINFSFAGYYPSSQPFPNHLIHLLKCVVEQNKIAFSRLLEGESQGQPQGFHSSSKASNPCSCWLFPQILNLSSPDALFKRSNKMALCFENGKEKIQVREAWVSHTHAHILKELESASYRKLRESRGGQGQGKVICGEKYRSWTWAMWYSNHCSPINFQTKWHKVISTYLQLACNIGSKNKLIFTEY